MVLKLSESKIKRSLEESLKKLREFEEYSEYFDAADIDGISDEENIEEDDEVLNIDDNIGDKDTAVLNILLQLTINDISKKYNKEKDSKIEKDIIDQVVNYVEKKFFDIIENEDYNYEDENHEDKDKDEENE